MKHFYTLLLFLYSVNAFAFNSHYDCIQVASSSVGWNSIDGRYEAGGKAKASKPITVKLTDLNSKVPYLAGQSTVKLTKITVTKDTLWLAEITPAGTVVTWTLFDKDQNSRNPKTLLISSKSYDIAGPFNFSTLYECKF